MARNDELASVVRERLAAHGVTAFNLVSSPGSGKTALLERTLADLGDDLRIAIVTGDVQTQNDAERLAQHTDQLVQAVVTGGACHLDARQISAALDRIELENTDLVFIENVGNLVCPASFDLGQHLNVTLLSVTEGDDKPSKYPVMFRAADTVLVTKTDLLRFLDDFDPDRAEQNLRALASSAPLQRLSARSGEGLDAWLGWLREQVAQQAARVAEGHSHRPKVQPGGAQLHSHA